MARGPAGAGGAVADRWNKLVADRWNKLVAWVRLPACAGPRRAAPNPTAGRGAQTRGLFSFVVVLTAFFIGLNAVNGLWPSVVPPGPALFSLLGLLVVLDGLSRIVLPAQLLVLAVPDGGAGRGVRRPDANRVGRQAPVREHGVRPLVEDRPAGAGRAGVPAAGRGRGRG